MKIKRSVCVGTSLLPAGFNELNDLKSRADLVSGLRNLTGLEIAEPVRTMFSCNVALLTEHLFHNETANVLTRVY